VNTNQSTITLERNVYYIYPNREVVTCSGITVIANNRWVFTPKAGVSIPKFSDRCSITFVKTLRLLADEHNIILPDDLGIESPAEWTGITVKKRGISIRPMYAESNGKIHQPAIYFACEEQTGFNSDIKNAMKVLAMHKIMKEHIDRI